MKAWTYEEITAKAEKAIKRSMQLAAKQSDPIQQSFHRTCAYGQFAMWDELTEGYRDGTGEDFKRLDALVKSLG